MFCLLAHSEAHVWSTLLYSPGAHCSGGLYYPWWTEPSYINEQLRQLPKRHALKPISPGYSLSLDFLLRNPWATSSWQLKLIWRVGIFVRGKFGHRNLDTWEEWLLMMWSWCLTLEMPANGNTWDHTSSHQSHRSQTWSLWRQHGPVDPVNSDH